VPPRILVAGIGNIFLGDDAFGVEVARRLAGRRLPEGVRVVDFGIRGFDLAYALLGDDDAVILVDATPRGGPAGTLYVLEIEANGPGEPDPQERLIEPHGMDPVKVLRLAATLGGPMVQRVLLVGCEPLPLGPDDDAAMGLSEPVQGAVDEAVLLIEALVAKLREAD
jgi:hydrogenase maturation protease